MNNTWKVPIKNIFYMLCYYWDNINLIDEINIESEEFDNIYSLLAKIYVEKTNKLIKRGLDKSYIEVNENLSLLRGKININRSINELTFISGRLNCKYDDFSENFVLNQIIKTTINLLISSEHVEDDIKDDLIKIQKRFWNTNEIKLSNTLLNSIEFNRNNMHYKILINITKLFYNGLIANEENGELKFLNCIDEEQMAKVYEKFVLNFYKKHLNENVYKVKSSKIKWSDNTDYSLLPEMRTDIVIENKQNKTQLIIDTKYTDKILVKNKNSETKKIKSTHLFQIYSYIKKVSIMNLV